jgi:outer membrane protein
MTRTSNPILIALALATLGAVPTAALAQAPSATGKVLTADRAVQLALLNNNQVVGSHADLLSARGNAYRAYTTIMPLVGGDVTRSGSGSTIGHLGYSSNKSVAGSWRVVDLSAWADAAAAHSGVRGAAYGLQATRTEVALQARRQFYAVVNAVKQVEVNTNAVRLARENSRRVRTLLEVGSVSRSDVLKQDVLTSQSVLDSIAAEQALLTQRNDLATLIGVAEGSMGEVDTVLALAPRAYDEASVLREAETNRPDLKAARATLAASRQSVLSSRLSWLPYVNMQGSATYYPETSLGFGAGRLSQGKQLVNGSLALSWDLFDGLTKAANSVSARALFERARSNYQVLTTNLAGQVHQAIMTYGQALATEQTAEAGLASASENLRLTQQKYNVGSATILDLVDAQVQLQRAQTQLISAQSGIQIAQAQIDQVRGVAP